MLSDIKIRSAKPGEKPYKRTDEKGMHLLVMPSGSKLWRLAYRFGGKQKLISLGRYPEVSLAMARERRDEARKALAAGIDPSAKRKAEKLAQTDTFKAVAEEFVLKFEPKWVLTYREKVKARLAWLYPVVGDKPISEIEAPDLLSALRPLEAAGKAETARRTLSVAGQVFRYAIATGRATHDPTAALRGALAPVQGRHHAAVTEPKAFGALLRAIEGYEGEPVTRSALRLLPLVFVRPGELRHAQWSEIDLNAATWAIPAAKMKMKHDHIVPLSTQAVTILRELHPLTGRRPLVFPSLRSRDRPMSENTINAALRRLGYDKDTQTGHGFRASARTLLDEVLGMRVDLIEHQLAHAVKDPLGRAYNRTAHLPERVKMMQAWSDYCDSLKAGADVIPIHRAKSATY
jgi:integrase